MDKAKREKQIEFLENMADREGASLYGDGPGYNITGNGKSEYCHCAETAIMVLNTEFSDVDVWVKRAFTPSQLKGE